jgi:hypothetical protein
MFSFPPSHCDFLGFRLVKKYTSVSVIIKHHEPVFSYINCVCICAGFSSYDAANMLVEARRPRLVERSRLVLFSVS